MHLTRACIAAAALLCCTFSAQAQLPPWPTPPSPTLEGMLEIGVRTCAAIIDGASPAEAAAAHGITLHAAQSAAQSQDVRMSNFSTLDFFGPETRVQGWLHVERAFLDEPARRNENLRWVTLVASEDGSKCHFGGVGRADIAATIARSIAADAPWRPANAASAGRSMFFDTWQAVEGGTNVVYVRMTRHDPPRPRNATPP